MTGDRRVRATLMSGRTGWSLFQTRNSPALSPVGVDRLLARDRRPG